MRGFATRLADEYILIVSDMGNEEDSCPFFLKG
jgi:hypothetical protein